MKTCVYNHLDKCLEKVDYVKNPICLCISIKEIGNLKFTIIIVYDDDLNHVGTLEKLIRTTNYFKKEFKIKYLGKTKFCFGL